MHSSAGKPTPTGKGARPPAPPVHRTLPLLARWALLAFAMLCLVLGVIGVFVPGLPTTVFILMAAWAAARSSPRLHEWLWYHRLFGPMLRDWREKGAIPRRAKYMAAAGSAFGFLLFLWGSQPGWPLTLLVAAIIAFGMIFVFTRPDA